MAKNKLAPKITKFVSLVATIKKLHMCIAKDQTNLTKLYEKVVTETGRKLIRINKALVKAKKSVNQAAKNKKKAPKNYVSAVSLLQSLKTELAKEKAEFAVLKSEYKRFNTQQKALKQIDKSFAKSAKTSPMKKRNIIENKPRAVKNAKSKTIAVHYPSSIDTLSDVTT